MPKLHIKWIDAPQFGLTQQNWPRRARLAVRQRAGVAQLLGQSGQRYLVSGRDAHAVAQGRQHRCHQRQPPEINQQWMRLLENVSTIERASRRIVSHYTCSRMTSWPMSRAAISAAWRAHWSEVLASYRSQPAGQHDHDRGQVKHAVGVRAAGSASCSPRCWYTADGRQFPELARPVHHHQPLPGRRSASSGCCSWHDVQRAEQWAIMAIGVATQQHSA